MSTNYTIQQGDCLSSIAHQYGFSDYDLIYSHPQNADFRQKRPNPNVIFPGDLLFIPDKEVKDFPRPTDVLHHFVLNRPKVLIRLCMLDDRHLPYKNTKYKMRVGFKYYQGQTDAAGLVEQEIAPESTDGSITLFNRPSDPADPGFTFTLKLGNLDPVTEVSGVDARLCNLGFGPHEQDGDLSDEHRDAALQAFQDRFGLKVTGQLDDTTRAKLKQLHDAA